MEVVEFLHEEEVGGGYGYDHQAEIEVMVYRKPDDVDRETGYLSARMGLLRKSS